MIHISEKAHEILVEKLSSFHLAVDMTCGLGRDTLFLASKFEHVLAVDLQEEAIAATKNLLTLNGYQNVTYLHKSHDQIESDLHAPIDAAIYNLGYLPGGDHEIHTSPDTTIASLKLILHHLRPCGRVVLVVYQKHTGNEAMQIRHYCANLPSQEYDVTRISVLNKELSPYLIVIDKIR